MAGSIVPASSISFSIICEDGVSLPVVRNFKFKIAVVKLLEMEENETNPKYLACHGQIRWPISCPINYRFGLRLRCRWTNHRFGLIQLRKRLLIDKEQKISK